MDTGTQCQCRNAKCKDGQCTEPADVLCCNKTCTTRCCADCAINVNCWQEHFLGLAQMLRTVGGWQCIICFFEERIRQCACADLGLGPRRCHSARSGKRCDHKVAHLKGLGGRRCSCWFRSEWEVIDIDCTACGKRRETGFLYCRLNFAEENVCFGCACRIAETPTEEEKEEAKAVAAMPETSMETAERDYCLSRRHARRKHCTAPRSYTASGTPIRRPLSPRWKPVADSDDGF